jgi:hypothetical protein
MFSFKEKVNDLQSIAVDSATAPLGTLRKAGTIIYDKDNEVSYFLTADASANKTLATITAKTQI